MFLVGWCAYHEGFGKESFEWHGGSESNNSGDGFMGDFYVCVARSCSILYLGHIYGEIERPPTLLWSELLKKERSIRRKP